MLTISIVAVLFTLASSTKEFVCKGVQYRIDGSYDSPYCVSSTCTDAITGHIELELDAAFKYIYLAAQFDDETVGRPGLAKFLYEAASEERDHAILMLSYLDRRGVQYKPVALELPKDQPLDNYIVNGDYKTALEMVMKMEMAVTEKLNEVVSKCEKDYDGADYFTEPILAEQFDGMRKLHAAVITLNDMKLAKKEFPDLDYQTQYEAQKNLAEFVVDQKFLKNEF